MVYLILVLYIGFTFLGSLRNSGTEGDTPESYFLANRNLNTIALFFTILATNFSAFYFLGFAGEGYRIGYAYYVVMALGTALACLSFFIIGNKVWQLGKKHGYITPAELIYNETGSKALRIVYASIMLIFTMPYLALQIIGAGYILESITEGQIPYFLGATLLTIFTILYVWIGGMKSVAKTDLKQGLLAIILMFLAVALISYDLGGLGEANRKVFEMQPDLFDRTGTNGFYTPQKWFSLLFFWIFCIPMFPQIFMRFYIARDLPQLKKSAILYALVPLFISIFPVIIGVLGHLSFPDLQGREADQILPMMLVEHTSKWFSALVMTGALAAFMSTLDSQLLALSTIVTRDLYLGFNNKKKNLQEQAKIGKVWVVVFALLGLAIAYQPFTTIFDMGKMAFSGLSILFPVTLAVLHWKRFSVPMAIFTIVIGEVLILAFYYQFFPKKWLLGFESFVPILILCFLLMGFGSLFSSKRKRRED